MCGKKGWASRFVVSWIFVLLPPMFFGCPQFGSTIAKDRERSTMCEGGPQPKSAVVEESEYPVLCDFLRNESKLSPEDRPRILVKTPVFNSHDIESNDDLPERVGMPVDTSVLQTFKLNGLEWASFDGSLFKCDGLDIVMVSGEDIQRVYQDNFKKLQNRLGREQIVIYGFSRVVFDLQRRSAYLVATRTTGGLSGIGEFVWMVKEDQGWKIQKRATYMHF